MSTGLGPILAKKIRAPPSSETLADQRSVAKRHLWITLCDVAMFCLEIPSHFGRKVIPKEAAGGRDDLPKS